jgi:hypothetical protein
MTDDVEFAVIFTVEKLTASAFFAAKRVVTVQTKKFPGPNSAGADQGPIATVRWRYVE